MVRIVLIVVCLVLAAILLAGIVGDASGQATVNSPEGGCFLSCPRYVSPVAEDNEEKHVVTTPMPTVEPTKEPTTESTEEPEPTDEPEDKDKKDKKIKDNNGWGPEGVCGKTNGKKPCKDE